MAKNQYEVIIVGGSYAGLSAAMTLGRSIRQVLVIDSGKPCNQQTPHSHNYLTQDGKVPAEIAGLAREQVLNYPTIEWRNGKVTDSKIVNDGFEVHIGDGAVFGAKKLLFATGLADDLPLIKGFAECWGISILHCPYCHGYEVKNKNIGVLVNGELALEFAGLIYHWSQNLTLFTNGPAALSREQKEKLAQHKIRINEKRLASFEHQNGMIEHVVFDDGAQQPIDALFARVAFKQHCPVPQNLGCELNEQGLIKVDAMGKTSVRGVYAAGDNSNMFRALSLAVAAGTKAGAMINRELIDESF